MPRLSRALQADAEGSAVRRRRILSVGYWTLAGLMVVVCVAGLLLTLGRARFARDGGASMENTIKPGDELIYEPGSAIRRGDLVLVRAPSDPAAALVRRLIGLPGDHVACCDASGQVTVDGKALSESYVYPGDAPSELKFSVQLGAGQIWLMGDQRSFSLDSRITGPAPLASVIGRVTIILGNGSFTAVATPHTFIADGLAPPDHRSAVPEAWLIISAAALSALILLLGGGLVAVLRRRRQSRPQLSASAA